MSDDSSSKFQGENIPLGDAKEQGIGTITMDSYLNTELIRRQKEEERQQKEKVEELQAILNIDYEQRIQYRLKDQIYILLIERKI